jgi:hypothetical protein
MGTLTDWLIDEIVNKVKHFGAVRIDCPPDKVKTIENGLRRHLKVRGEAGRVHVSRKLGHAVVLYDAKRSGTNFNTNNLMRNAQPLFSPDKVVVKKLAVGEVDKNMELARMLTGKGEEGE